MAPKIKSRHYEKIKMRVEVGRYKPTVGQYGSPFSILQLKPGKLPQQDSFMQCSGFSPWFSGRKLDNIEEGWKVTFLSSLVPRTRDRGWFTHLFSTACGFATISLKGIAWDILSFSLNYCTDALRPLIMFRKNQQSDGFFKVNILSIQQWIWK